MDVKLGNLGQSEEFMQYLTYPERLRHVAPLLERLQKNIEADDTILDVGCFVGYVWNWLNRHKIKYSRYMGIDIEPAHIYLARENHHKSISHMFQHEDLFQCQETADHVFCSRVLIHLENWPEALEKLWSMTNKYLYVNVKIDKMERVTEHFHKKVGDYKIYHITGRRLMDEVGKLEGVAGTELDQSNKYAVLVLEKEHGL